MNATRTAEIVAVILTVLGTAGAISAPFYVGAGGGRPPAAPAGAQLIRLTAVAAQGIWTDEKVGGLNYWRPLAPAAPVVRAGREVILQLQSADDEHGFSIPDLGIGPIKVEAGHLVEVRFTPQVPGRYAYQCTTRCGRCHEAMTGWIVVVGPAETPEMYPPPPALEEKPSCP